MYKLFIIITKYVTILNSNNKIMRTGAYCIYKDGFSMAEPGEVPSLWFSLVSEIHSLHCECLGSALRDGLNWQL